MELCFPVLSNLLKIRRINENRKRQIVKQDKEIEKSSFYNDSEIGNLPFGRKYKADIIIDGPK